MIKQVFFSAAWGVSSWLVSAMASASYAENYYRARVAEGGDPAFGDIGFTWLSVTVGIGLFAFTLGLFGILPGTRQK